MWTIETAIRLIVIGQVLLIAAVFLFGSGTRVARVSGALLMLSVVGYLFTSDDALRTAAPGLLPVMALAAMSVSYCVWLFARAIFEAQWPNSAISITAVTIGVAVWLIQVNDPALESLLAHRAGIALRIIAMVIVTHALWLAITGRPDDLIERRRTFRLFFVAAISFQVIAVLVVELMFIETVTPSWLQLTNVIIIAILAMGLAIPLLRLNDEFFGPEPQPVPTGANKVHGVAPSPAEGVYREKLVNLMNSGFYRETGLTITTLAKELDYPEHQLRKLINGHLRYRNFSAFLNGYRISAAQEELANPRQARTPILTLALDLGYASIGPFNRAFKEATGVTPTDFRRQNLGRASTDSE